MFNSWCDVRRPRRGRAGGALRAPCPLPEDLQILIRGFAAPGKLTTILINSDAGTVSEMQRKNKTLYLF